MFGVIITILSGITLTYIIWMTYPISIFLKIVFTFIIIELILLYIREKLHVVILKDGKPTHHDITTGSKKVPETYDQLKSHVDFNNIKEGILDINFKEVETNGFIKKKKHLIGISVYETFLAARHNQYRPLLRLPCHIYVNKEGKVQFVTLSQDSQISLLRKIRECSLNECADLIEIFTANRIHTIIYSEDLNYILDQLNSKYNYLLDYAFQSLKQNDKGTMAKIAKDEKVIDYSISLEGWKRHYLDKH